MHRLGLQLHSLPLALQVVGAVAVNFASTVRRGHLLYIADETGKHTVYQLAANVVRRVVGVDLVLHVVARGGGP